MGKLDTLQSKLLNNNTLIATYNTEIQRLCANSNETVTTLLNEQSGINTRLIDIKKSLYEFDSQIQSINHKLKNIPSNLKQDLSKEEIVYNNEVDRIVKKTKYITDSHNAAMRDLLSQKTLLTANLESLLLVKQELDKQTDYNVHLKKQWRTEMKNQLDIIKQMKKLANEKQSNDQETVTELQIQILDIKQLIEQKKTAKLAAIKTYYDIQELIKHNTNQIATLDDKISSLLNGEYHEVEFDIDITMATLQNEKTTIQSYITSLINRPEYNINLMTDTLTNDINEYNHAIEVLSYKISYYNEGGNTTPLDDVANAGNDADDIAMTLRNHKKLINENARGVDEVQLLLDNLVKEISRCEDEFRGVLSGLSDQNNKAERRISVAIERINNKWQSVIDTNTSELGDITIKRNTYNKERLRLENRKYMIDGEIKKLLDTIISTKVCEYKSLIIKLEQQNTVISKEIDMLQQY